MLSAPIREVDILDYDVLILGGGPAGSATALALKKHAPDLSILLIEASLFEKPRIGEVLPALAKNLLEHLGVWGDFERENHSTVYNMLAAWGEASLRENHGIFSTHGAGWHLDRKNFDAFLLAQAARSGAKILFNKSLVSFEQTETGWFVKLSDNSETGVRFIVDATGRRAFFARKTGAMIRTCDRLVSFSRFFTLDEQSASETLIESFADGWWYSARAGKKRVISCLTDADIAADLSLNNKEIWMKLFSQMNLIPKNIGGGVPDGEHITRSVNTALTIPACQNGWLAVGDAASAFDPLSSKGITKALRSAIFASYAIADLLVKCDPAAIARYAKFIETEFSVYKKQHRKHYSTEQRWRDKMFWQRRHNQNQRGV